LSRQATGERRSNNVLRAHANEELRALAQVRWTLFVFVSSDGSVALLCSTA
jgi:hypothetical protein